MPTSPRRPAKPKKLLRVDPTGPKVKMVPVKLKPKAIVTLLNLSVIVNNDCSNMWIVFSGTVGADQQQLRRALREVG